MTDWKSIDPDKLVAILRDYELRSLRQPKNFVAPIMAGMFEMLARAVRESTVKAEIPPPTHPNTES